MLSLLGYVAIQTPTHAQALLGLALLIACLPALILFASAIARARSRRASEFIEGVCARCGYSLQGLPSGTICPECGADTSIVGTRRPRRRLGSAWIACTLWIVLLLTLNSFFKFEIDGYIHRLVWHEEYWSRWMQSSLLTQALRLASIVALIGVGVPIIIWFCRLPVAPAGPASAEERRSETGQNQAS
jgi:hypothetical protein